MSVRTSRADEPCPLPLDFVLDAVWITLRDGAAGATDPGDTVDLAFASLRCTDLSTLHVQSADLSTLHVQCLACGNGSVFDPELATILCGVGCGQPVRGEAVATIRARWVDILQRAGATDSGGLSPFDARHLAESYASARLVDGDARPAGA